MVEPDARLREIARTLATVFPATPSYAGEHGKQEPVPHLTLAKCPPDDLARVAAEMEPRLQELLPLSQWIGAISIEEQSDNGGWAVTKTLELGRHQPG